MSNRHIPMSQRNTTPLITNGSKILWVIPYQTSQFAKVTHKTTTVLKISVINVWDVDIFHFTLGIPKNLRRKIPFRSSIIVLITFTLESLSSVHWTGIFAISNPDFSAISNNSVSKNHLLSFIKGNILSIEKVLQTTIILRSLFCYLFFIKSSLISDWIAINLSTTLCIKISYQNIFCLLINMRKIF